MPSSKLIHEPEYLLCEAYTVASFSPDQSNQNGALIISYDEDILSEGCNTFTPGIEYDPTIHDRDWKIAHIEHAERMALFTQRDNLGLRMVCPWFACAECARAIVLSGICAVYGHKARMDTTPDRWLASVAAGNKILDAAGVKRFYLDIVVPDAPIIKVNGKDWCADGRGYC